MLMNIYSIKLSTGSQALASKSTVYCLAAPSFPPRVSPRWQMRERAKTGARTKKRELGRESFRALSHPPTISRRKKGYYLQSSVVYEYRCDANYVSYTRRNLHQRTDEHRYPVIGKHEQSQRCQGKFDFYHL